jgi:3-oxoacyl-[acyl-carrier protein] reductase
VTPGLAVVTGAAGGIGWQIAVRLLAEGRPVLLVDSRPSVQDTAIELGDGASAVIADLTTEHGVASVVDRVRASGPLSTLVNNAGITRDGRAKHLTAEQFSAVLEVNLVAALRLTLALHDAFGEGGSVVNMGSRASLGNFGQANYVCSKAALAGSTRALALGWAPRIRVNAVLPGLVDTPMTQQMPEHVLAKLVDRIPLARIGAPADVADAVAYLASDQAAYVTGQMLIVCGGRSLAA